MVLREVLITPILVFVKPRPWTNHEGMREPQTRAKELSILRTQFAKVSLELLYD